MKEDIKNKYDLLLLKNQLCFPMYSATNRIVNNYRPLLKSINLTYTQYIVMMVMWEKEQVHEKDLVDALYLKSNTLAPLLKKLESKGLVDVKKDKKDKRNIIISITSKGKKLKEKAVEVPVKYGENFPLDLDEVKALKKILVKIINWKILEERIMIYDYKVPKSNGEELNLSDYKGKVIMVVNTATGCGFTPQYAPIEEMYKNYHEKGLEILDIPCNQFGGQAPGSDTEIHEFCTIHYNTTFPQMKKSDVNGANELPLYTYLKSQKGFEGFPAGQHKELLEQMMAKVDPDWAKKPDIKWNFTKFIIDRNGNVVARFEPMADMKEVEECVKSLL